MHISKFFQQILLKIVVMMDIIFCKLSEFLYHLFALK